ncbi:MAG: hypothetical protein M0008_00915 [Actinomycetota bacterium]|nr:hypothetical protein [Actinomycetota bacterium]
MGSFKKPGGLVARSGMTGLLAAAMLMVGGGIGAMAALATTPAGAATAHSSLPPVNVSVANTPNVNVANLPVNSQGRLRVSQPVGAPHAWGCTPWGCLGYNNQQMTMVNVSGPGVFKGLTWSALANMCGNNNPGCGPNNGGFDGGNCGAYDGEIWVYIDNHLAWFTIWSWNAWPSVGWNGNNTGISTVSPFYNNDPVQGGSVTPWCNGQGLSGFFWPPGGIAFSSNLKVLMQPAGWWPGGVPVWFGARSYFTTGYSSGS